MRQLDLFIDFTPPTAEVYRLPARRWGPTAWRSQVKSTAADLHRRRTQSAKERLWASRLTAIEATLRRAGATDGEITEQLDQFFLAVDAEMARQMEKTA